MIKRYRVAIILLILNLIFGIIYPAFGLATMKTMQMNLTSMLSVLPPIFLILGLLDVWVDRSTMVRYMGEGSGLKGHLLAFIMGAVGAGPLYTAFPMAALLLKKGATFQNVCFFLGIWSTTKIPTFLFEATSMGLNYTVVRFICNVIGIGCTALVMDRITSKEDKEELVVHVQELDV